jgi:hypothetical protein
VAPGEGMSVIETEPMRGKKCQLSGDEWGPKAGGLSECGREIRWSRSATEVSLGVNVFVF